MPNDGPLYVPMRIHPWETLELDDPTGFVANTFPRGIKTPPGQVGFLQVFESLEALEKEYGKGAKHMVVRDMTPVPKD